VIESGVATAAEKSGSTADDQDISSDKSHSLVLIIRCENEIPALTGAPTRLLVWVPRRVFRARVWFTNDTVSRAVSAEVAHKYQEKLVSLTCVIAVSYNTNTKRLPSSDDSKVDRTVSGNVKLDKKALLDQGYRQTEEALTYAKLRQCSYCKVSFLIIPPSRMPLRHLHC
jgi:hypothetical protein